MAGGSGARFTWYGHACVELVTASGTTVLFDPWFGNPRSPKVAAEVERCDVLLVSHGHDDHDEEHAHNGHAHAAPAATGPGRAHESPPIMTLPLIVLAVFALGVGFFLGPLTHGFADPRIYIRRLGRTAQKIIHLPQQGQQHP